jgi:hypothetical protein
MKKFSIHWYELHYNGVSAGDHYTNVPGLVTCAYCKRLLAKRRRTKDAPDLGESSASDNESKPVPKRVI